MKIPKGFVEIREEEAHCFLLNGVPVYSFFVYNSIGQWRLAGNDGGYKDYWEVKTHGGLNEFYDCTHIVWEEQTILVEEEAVIYE